VLKGLKVAELATFVAGPGAAGLMADWGATVIKVEAPGGDPIRWNRPPAREGSSSPSFEFDNRGKRSIVIDIRKSEGRDVMHRLAGWADVFITNLRPGRAAKAGIDYESMSTTNPRLIYASITGYGLQSTMADVASFDKTGFWARSGLLGQIVPPGGYPIRPRPAMGDHCTGIAVALGVMTALWSRAQTGRGQLVDCSLLRTANYVFGYDITEQLQWGRSIPAPRRSAEGLFQSPPSPTGWHYDFVAKNDDWFCISLTQEQEEWPRLFRVAGRPDMSSDERFADVDSRVVYGLELVDNLEKAFLKMDREEIGAGLERENIMWSPIHTAKTAITDPVNISAGCFVEVDDGKSGTFRAPAAPVQFPGAESGNKGPVPSPGQHTDNILAEMGYSAAQIASLRQGKVVD
jgi:crotonobetainyl-CoA:carnitine CoA-transferase CaiB-like acyl-CoA transferase